MPYWYQAPAGVTVVCAAVALPLRGTDAAFREMHLPEPGFGTPVALPGANPDNRRPRWRPLSVPRSEHP